MSVLPGHQSDSDSVANYGLFTHATTDRNLPNQRDMVNPTHLFNTINAF